MPSLLSTVRRCPQPACSGAMTIAPEAAVSSGQPLWLCSEGHHGPRFVGAQV